MKKCTSCHNIKSEKDFYKDNAHKSKLRSNCKECCDLAEKERRQKYPERYILKDIKDRCNNAKNQAYKWYGGRGIKCLITEEEIKELMIRDGYWDMEKPSIDRIDNDGNYCIENCRFIELSENISKDKKKILCQYDLQGNFIKEWESSSEASRQLKITVSHLFEVANKKRASANKSIWRYKKDSINIAETCLNIFWNNKWDIGSLSHKYSINWAIKNLLYLEQLTWKQIYKEYLVILRQE